MYGGLPFNDYCNIIPVDTRPEVGSQQTEDVFKYRFRYERQPPSHALLAWRFYVIAKLDGKGNLHAVEGLALLYCVSKARGGLWRGALARRLGRVEGVLAVGLRLAICTSEGPLQ